MGMDFNQRLDLLMLQSNITEEELAEEMGVEEDTVRGWLNAGIAPSTEQLVRLAHFFDVTLNRLIGVKYYPRRSRQPRTGRKYRFRANIW